jgi:S-layer protein
VDTGAAFTGTAGNDTFNASIVNGGAATLNAGDRLVGGEGSDNLNVVITTTGTGATVAAQAQVNTYTVPTVTADVQQSNQFTFSTAAGVATQTFTVGAASSSFQSATVAATQASAFAAAVNSTVGSTIAFVGGTVGNADITDAVAGSVITMLTTAGIQVGMTAAGTNMGANSVVTAVTATTVTVSAIGTYTGTADLVFGGGTGAVTVKAPTAGVVAPAIAFGAVGSAGSVPTSALVVANVDGNVGDSVSFTYNGVTSSYVIGATQAATADAFEVALDAIVGAEAVVTSPTTAVVVTSATAGTALLPITFSAAAGNVPTGAITTPNVVGVTGIATPVTIAAADVSGVETVTVTNTGGEATLDATTYLGVTNFVSNVSTGANIFNDIGTADLTVVGDDIATNGNVSFRSSDTASVTDALTVNIRGGVNAGNITSTNANDDWTSVTINSSGGTATATTAANVVGALDLGGGDRIQTVTINADSSLTMTSLVGFNTTTADVANKGAIVINGNSQVTLGTLDAAVETLNASASTGSIRFTASTQTDFQFVGGAGDDRVTTGAVLSTTVAAPGSINAGAGSADRLIVADSTHVTTTVGDKYAGFEQLEVANGVTVDMDHLATNNTIGTIRLTTGGAVNDMTAAQALNVTVTEGGNGPTLTVKNGTTLGNVDTVKITASDELATFSTIDLVTPVLTGVEKLELVATDSIIVGALTSALSLDTITITGARTVGITSGTSFGNTNQLVDASNATGVQTLDFSGATAAVRILGGSAADIITVNVNVANVINGGGGIDTINLGGSDGADVQSDVVGTADFDVIASFATTLNDFDYNGALSNGAGTVTGGISAAEIGSSTTLAAALAAAGAGDDIVFIATTDISGVSEAALDVLRAAPTAANAAAAIEAVATNTFNAVAGLDAVLGASDFVLVQISTDTDTFVFRVNNFNTTVADSLIAQEISLVGVFVGAVDLVAGDYI